MLIKFAGHIINPQCLACIAIEKISGHDDELIGYAVAVYLIGYPGSIRYSCNQKEKEEAGGSLEWAKKKQQELYDFFAPFLGMRKANPCPPR